MEKEHVLKFLNKYNYNYTDINSDLIVKLDFGQQIEIEFSTSDKIIIKDSLASWNFLTGMLQMSLKNAVIYNFIGTLILGLIFFFSENQLDILHLNALFLVYIVWILMFTAFYLVKLEGFKNQLVNWTKE